VDKFAPVVVLDGLTGAPMTGVKKIAAGGAHSLALKQDGSLWAWGDNSHGQLGNTQNTTGGLASARPVSITAITGKIVAIAAGGSHSLALTEDGTVWGWGYNEFGQLGDGTGTTRFTPAPSVLKGVVDIAAGLDHSVAIVADPFPGGTRYAWAMGYNYYGQLGNNSVTTSSVPVQVVYSSGVPMIAVQQITAIGHHNLAWLSDGSLWAWGENGYGQLGDLSTDSRSTPVRVTGF
jgi:alpha-tubulin suppressor-like RCC1 family protein